MAKILLVTYHSLDYSLRSLRYSTVGSRFPSGFSPYCVCKHVNCMMQEFIMLYKCLIAMVPFYYILNDQGLQGKINLMLISREKWIRRFFFTTKFKTSLQYSLDTIYPYMSLWAKTLHVQWDRLFVGQRPTNASGKADHLATLKDWSLVSGKFSALLSLSLNTAHCWHGWRGGGELETRKGTLSAKIQKPSQKNFPHKRMSFRAVANFRLNMKLSPPIQGEGHSFAKCRY